ncbi:hypothetical protein RD792_004011 [Penstemon davidsonii]|uniref:Protein kinase domain-containing protein n=1 Tax=Penstemon davidsonii TaxID=160366 RepID=A0ABR0DGU7_9LAMI|nr:hypothetical protein RD792_004011 [Penstemon davidsonii]
MLVFEYASNGTLYEHLHYGEGCQLSWTRCMKIIVGIAQGLKYLHTELNPPFTISELNSNSIYLTEDFSPKAKEFLEVPDVMSYVVDPELKHFRYEELKVIFEVVNLCMSPSSSTRTSIRDLCDMLESGIDTSISAEIKASSLAWAELELSS